MPIFYIASNLLLPFVGFLLESRLNKASLDVLSEESSTKSYSGEISIEDFLCQTKAIEN